MRGHNLGSKRGVKYLFFIDTAALCGDCIAHRWREQISYGWGALSVYQESSSIDIQRSYGYQKEIYSADKVTERVVRVVALYRVQSRHTHLAHLHECGYSMGVILSSLSGVRLGLMARRGELLSCHFDMRRYISSDITRAIIWRVCGQDMSQCCYQKSWSEDCDYSSHFVRFEKSASQSEADFSLGADQTQQRGWCALVSVWFLRGFVDVSV